MTKDEKRELRIIIRNGVAEGILMAGVIAFLFALLLSHLAALFFSTRLWF
jgi:hypothetical protein